MTIALMCITQFNVILFITIVWFEKRKYKFYNSVLAFQPQGDNIQYLPVTLHQYVGLEPNTYQILPFNSKEDPQVNESPRVSMQQKQQQVYQNMVQPQNIIMNNQVYNQRQQIQSQQQFQPKQQYVIQPHLNPTSLYQLNQQQPIINQQVVSQQQAVKQTKATFLDDLEENLM
eukprot:403362569